MEELVPVLVVFIVIGLPIILVFVLSLVKTLKGDARKGISREASEEETRLIQQMYHSVARMEERIEVLEDIVLERARRRKD